MHAPLTDRLDLLFQSVRHVPPAQLLRRLELVGRRRYRALCGPPSSFERRRPACARELPVPVLPARTELVSFDGDGAWLNVYGHRERFGRDFSWGRRDGPDWTHLRRFRLHYMEWVEGLTDDDLVRAVDSWIEENPPYVPDYWVDGWSSYVLSVRTVVWMQQLAARSNLAKAFRARATESIVDQIRVLRDHLELDLRGNHLVKNAKALLWASAFFDGEEARGWGEIGQRLLAEVLDEQILSDGLHYERSASYHAQVVADLIECSVVLPAGGLAARVADLLPRCLDALGHVTHPDGGPMLMNDAGLTMAYAPRVLRNAVGVPNPGGTAPGGAFCLPDAGYYGYRGDRDYLVVKAGPIGPDSLPAHAHADLLSFEWDVAGKRMIVDPGVAEYAAGPGRSYARSTAAHNTVTVDGADQCEMWSSFRVGRRGRAYVDRWTTRDTGVVLDAWHDGYARLDGAPIHRRRLEFDRGRLLVEDRVASAAPRRAVGGFLFHPEAALRAEGREWVVERGGTTIVVRASEAGAVCDARWMPDVGVSQPARRLQFDLSPCAPLRVEFLPD